MGYHKRKIEKGTFGRASKIREEFEEFWDAVEQVNPVLEILELSDVIGAITEYVKIRYNLTIIDLIKMARATESAFEEGERR